MVSKYLESRGQGPPPKAPNRAREASWTPQGLTGLKLVNPETTFHLEEGLATPVLKLKLCLLLHHSPWLLGRFLRGYKLRLSPWSFLTILCCHSHYPPLMSSIMETIHENYSEKDWIDLQGKTGLEQHKYLVQYNMQALISSLTCYVLHVNATFQKEKADTIVLNL